MLWQLADRLMLQYQRHFMIHRPGQPTVAAITPFVRTWYVRSEAARGYMENRLSGFLTPGEVDAELRKVHESLAQDTEPRVAAEREPGQPVAGVKLKDSPIPKRAAKRPPGGGH